MKRTILILTAIFLCNTLFALENQTKDLVKVFDVNKGMELHAQINPGDIIVETWDAAQVKVTVKGLREDDYDDVDIEMRANRLVVEYDDRSGSNNVEFVFTIPENFHMSMNTTGGDIKINDKIIGRVYIKTSGGNITTRDMQGEFSCTTMGGDIKLGNVHGKLNAGTQGGDIRVGNVTGESASLNTMGGDIKIQNSEGSLSATTYGGDIKTGDAGGDVSAVTYGGEISLGNVSGSVSMETYGGDLALEGARGTVSADTKGGDVKLQNITGSVDASTAGGDISVELTPSESGHSTLKSSGGDIDLIIPDNAKVSIEAEIRLQGNARGKTDKYTITSDFLNIDQELSDNGKRISMSTVMNGGGHKIILRTTNSDIKILKQK
jgi:DUF4097 and DUF4098 domain-containing protein YvlB